MSTVWDPCLYIWIDIHVYMSNSSVVVSDLLLFLRCGAQQDVQQDVGQQVQRHSVVVFDDETAAVKHFTGQIMTHLQHTHTHTGLYQPLKPGALRRVYILLWCIMGFD